ncbi:hypothetical protein [Archaeoglobus veneficus]|uniref:Uncharacterized protein n=1 Tax=Archaeoglobus veneficus (strain DSM 11195 / SNP6) TaxID=693661 RepID=F2KTC9_ARCVS|nr:hypothetical protein [Archaeoglobus veneficus]AEA47159.1 hypothetical protein Arcve_1151 [Archaeoglobus veneficus SNP6]
MNGTKLPNLLIAELAFFISWMAYSSSSLSAFFSPVYLLPLAAIPLIRLRKGNPFSFDFFAVLLAMHSAYLLPGTEVFNSALDALYVLGYKGLSEYIYSAFPPASSQSLPIVVLLFCLSQLSEEAKPQQLAIASAISLIAFIAYPHVVVALNAEFVVAMAAVGIAAIAVYAFKAS